MGIFGLFSSKNNTAGKKSDYSLETIKANAKRHQDESNRELLDMQKADEKYKEDGDIEKCISVYERYMSKTPWWNSFNYNLRLANLYFKAGRNDQAWGYTNQMILWAVDPSVPMSNDVPKIRHLQFKILKSEKKYRQAFETLVTSYVINAYGISGVYFNKEKFIKEIKTTARAIGFSEKDLNDFADDLEKKIKKRVLKENKVRDYCGKYIDSVVKDGGN